MEPLFSGHADRPCSLSAAIRLAADAAAQMRASERLMRRANAKGAPNAARRFAVSTQSCANATQYWLKIAAQHAASAQNLTV